MLHTAEQFLQLVDTDPTLQARLADADGDIGQMTAIAGEAGFVLAPEALKDACASRASQLDEPQVHFDHPIVYFG